MPDVRQQRSKVPYGAWRQYQGHHLVYFLQADCGGPIYLGHTGDLQARFRKVERESRQALVIRRTMRFSNRQDARLEADDLALRFRRAQISPGVFRATPELARIARARPEQQLTDGEQQLAAAIGIG